MAKQIRSPIRAKALLFDMDGTLLLSHAVVERVWRGWAAEHGLDADHIIAISHGRRAIDTLREIRPPGVSIEEEAERLGRLEREDTDGIVAVDGAMALLSVLAPERWAMVTSADLALATVRLGAAGLPLPAVRVTAEDVTIGKPDPQGYREGARRLGLSPEDCIVFEDAPAGIAAGHASGAHVVVVASVLKPETLHGEDWITDYRDLSVSVLENGDLLVS